MQYFCKKNPLNQEFNVILVYFNQRLLYDQLNNLIFPQNKFNIG